MEYEPSIHTNTGETGDMDVYIIFLVFNKTVQLIYLQEDVGATSDDH